MRRLAACGYDWLIALALIMVLSVPVVAFLGEAEETGYLPFQIILSATPVAYFCCFWHYGGQTPGMRAWCLRVVSDHGATEVTWQQALLRALWSVVALAPAGMGFWLALTNPNRLTWHDRYSHTRLVLVEKGAGH